MSDLHGITMPCFGTSLRTSRNARALMEAKKARDTETKKAAQRAAQAATEAENGVINDENISDERQGNGLDGIGARGQIGVFPKAAGEPNARISGDQSEAGRSRENPESADLREVSPEELGITGAQNPVMLIDPERAGGSIADAADTVRSVGMEPVAFRGELRVGNASVNGYIEDGRIFFRTDAVDNRGREITAEQIVEHELFHAAAETDPQLVEDVKEVVQERMSEAEFDTMMADYAAAYSKVQDFSDWTAEQIAEYLYQEITADAYAGLNYFNDTQATVEAAKAAAPQVGQNQIDRSGAETRGPPNGRAALNLGFEAEFDEWLKDTTGEERLRDGSRFLIGTTSDKLRLAGVDDYEIYFGKSKIAKIMQNPEMTADVIKAAVKVVEDPVVVLDSKTVAGSIVMFGDAKTNNGKPVMVSLLLHPETRTGEVLDYGVVTSAYGRRVNNAQNLIDTSIVRYIDQNEKRTSEWSKALGLQLPSASTKRGSVETVPQAEAESNRNLPRASVEVSGTTEQLTPEEKKLVKDRTVTLENNGQKIEIEIRKAYKDKWNFSVRAVGNRAWFDTTRYDTPQAAAKAAMEQARKEAMEKADRNREALNRAAEEATEQPPPIGRFTKAERDAEEDRIRTLVESDAPWGTGDVMRKRDSEGQAAADEFAQERAERQAAKSMESDFREYSELLRGQMPIKKEDAAESKVTTGVSLEKVPWKKKVSNTWRSLVRTITNAEDTIHRIGRKTGNKALDGYYFRAMAARQIGTEWITGKRHDLLGRATGKGLNEIFSPIRAKGQDYYEQFQLYLYHMLNIDRMSRDYEAEAREAQAEVTRLENIEPAISRLSPETLERIAGGVSIDAQFAKDYMEAVAKRNKAEKRRPKPVFGFDVTADDSRAAVDRLLEKHPEFAELAQDVYDFSNDLMQYRVDAGLIRQQDKDYMQKLYPHYVPTFRVLTDEDAKVVHKGGLSVSKAIGRATGSDEKLLPLHVSLARQAMTVTKNGTINRLGNVLLETRDANKEYMSQYIREVKDAESGFNEDTFDEEERVEPERKKNVITIIENGKKYDLTLDEGLAEAFEAFEPDKWANNDIAQAAKKVTDIYKKLITAYNPLFVVRNMLKDIQDAGLYSKDMKAWAENFPLAYREIIREGKYWQMYTGLGGNYASIFDYTTGEATADGSGIIGRIEHLNRIVEAAPRMAEFMAMVKKAEARGPLTEADLMEAFEAAQDVTTNFGRAGRLGKMLNKYFVPFLNPGIQGADKFIRNLTERKGLREWSQLVVRAAALGIAPAIINGLLHRDKEDWEEEWDDISEAAKANYYLFKLRDGVWLKIPRGRALAVLGAAGVAVSETVKGNEIDPKDLLEVIKDNIAPQNPLEANIFRALLDSKLWIKDDPGRTWYGGEIESEYMQSFRPSERYDASTDYLSRWLGKTFDLSPAKINYLIDQYSGVVGDLLLPYITPESSAGLANIKGVPLFIGVRKNFSVDTVANNETTGEWYDLMDELDWDENGGDIAAGTTNRYMAKANKVVSDYYRQIREIEADTELNNQEKQNLTRALRRELIGYQKEILETEGKYRLAAEDYYDDHPELDHEDDAAVKTYMEQYNAQQASEEYYKNEEKTADLMAAIVYREVNREVLGAEYALETYSADVYERAVKVHNGAAVSYDTYYDYYFGTKDMHADRDEKGESISGTKKAKVLGFIADMDIPDEQKDALAIDAGYKAGSWKSYGGGKTGGGGGGRGRSKKAKAVKMKNTLTKPVGISYNRSMSIAARTPKEASAYEDIQKATSQLRKKNPWYELPTGNPELDEERPAAARYFETGKF